MPLSNIFPHPTPDRATPLNKGGTEVRWNTLYASTLVKEAKAPDEIQVDGEFLRTALCVKRGLTDWVEMSIELPFLHYTSGFLDSTIEDYHDAFGFPQGKRDRNPDDQYSAIYKRNGQAFFAAEEDGFHIGDIPIGLKVALTDPSVKTHGLAARALLELPTGDEDKGYGSGEIEGGVGLVAQKSFWPTMTGYFSVDHIFRKTPDDFHDINVAHVTHGSLAFEQVFAGSFSVILQSDYQTRPLKGSDLQQYDKPEWTGSMGLGAGLGERSWILLSFTEGITSHTTPDFVVGLSLGVRF